MSVRSSSVASVSRDVSLVTSCLRSGRRARPPVSRSMVGDTAQDRVGLADDALDDLARGRDLGDEGRALTAGRVTMLDIAVFARDDRGRKAHVLRLQRKGQDLGGPALPLAGERVLDRPTGLAGGALVHDGALLVDSQDFLLVVVVAVTLVGRDEAGADPHADRPERERRREAAA